MNATSNYSEYSFSPGENVSGHKSVADSCISSNGGNYMENCEKRNDFVNISNDDSMYVSSVNFAEKEYALGRGKNNYEQGYTGGKGNVQRHRKGSCDDSVVNLKGGNCADTFCGSDCDDGGDRGVAERMHSSLDMSCIYNKYDKNGLIYCKKIKFHMKNERENDYIDFLVVKINTLKNAVGKSYMRLELSNDKKESFFYYLDLFEENYENIKKEQKLVINFNLFPFKFIDLLEECVLESEQCEDADEQRLNAVLILEQKAGGDPSNTATSGYSGGYNSAYNSGYSGGYTGAYNGAHGGHSGYGRNTSPAQSPQNGRDGRGPEQAILNLVEINQFKELTHLSLVLRRADSDSVITYLCNSIRYIKEYNEEVIKKLNEEIVTNNKSSLQIKSLQKNIEKMEKGIAIMKADFSNTLTNDIHNLREEHQKIIEMKEEKYFSENKDLKKDVENLKNKCTQLNQTNENNEQKIFYLTSQVKTLKNELEEKNINFVKLVKEKENIEEEKYILEKEKKTYTVELNDLKCKYEKECESNISNSSSYESIKINNSSLEIELKKYKDRNEKLEKEINVAIDEINKGNDIITKLQSQLKKMKDKLKTKAAEHADFEKRSTQNACEIGKLQGEINSLQVRLAEKEAAHDTLRRDLEHAHKKNEEILKELNISREVNLRLNKEITNNSLDMYTVKLNNMGGGSPNVMTGTYTEEEKKPRREVATVLDVYGCTMGNLKPDKDLFTKLKANLKNSTPGNLPPSYGMENNVTNVNLMNGKIDTLGTYAQMSKRCKMAQTSNNVTPNNDDNFYSSIFSDMNDRYNKPVKFIPPGI
ncbi:spindle assembly abnormal protein 6, putative (SAS6) [Plasmodium ovale wallikeri]|uniref:Spindle assembly abnormal protein 6, putative (SAS6) n=1 Tax=Plasmodium ovale wallikeri TaxID=864142 RepID=A0A1A8Z738_PLAOA|nr:spindle assembly abnormal protein 6, putative (SAS6) [Plasmodium ovale wallikeri]